MADLSIITKVENIGQVTSDINVALQIENGVFGTICGWSIWNVGPRGWARIPIIVYNIEGAIGPGNYKITAWVWEKITPGRKIQDIIDQGVKVGELYENFTSVENELDYAEAPFTF